MRTCREPIRTPEQDHVQKPLQVTLQAEEWGFSCALPPGGNFLRSSAPKMTRLSLGLELGSGLKEIASDFKDLTSTKWHSFFVFLLLYVIFSCHRKERPIGNSELKQGRIRRPSKNLIWKYNLAFCNYFLHISSRLAQKIVSILGLNRPFQLVHFFFPFQTTWCPHENLPFVFSLVMRKFARA